MTSRELCKQEAPTPGVYSWGSCVSEGFTYERHEKVWNERKSSTSLHWTVSHTLEVWKCGIQVGIATLVGRSTRYLPRVTAKKCLKASMDVVLSEVAPLKANLTYPEHRVKILDQKNRVT
jgi:hypothetical protein